VAPVDEPAEEVLDDFDELEDEDESAEELLDEDEDVEEEPFFAAARLSVR